MNKWIREGNPNKEGYYFITDGYGLVCYAYYHFQEGWGIFQGIKCIRIDDMNLRIYAYCEPSFPKRLPMEKIDE